MQLDSIPEVKHWVRNMAKHPNSLYLPVFGTSTRTDPDSVVELTHGRTLLVEYKGAHLVADYLEKQAIGQLWQQSSEGNGAYVFAENDRDIMNVKAQILDALEHA